MLIPTVLVAVYVTCSTVLTSGLDKPYYDLEDAENLFRLFVKQHGKVYNRREYAERLEIFKENLQDINMRNEKYPMTLFELNHMADLTHVEMEQYFGFQLSNETKTVTVPDGSNDAPDEFDWRKHGVVSHIKYQGHCGSCYIFSAIGNIEGQYAIKHKQCLALSEGQALDCLRCGSCYGGLVDAVMDSLSKRAGVMKEDDYPYAPRKQKCHEDTSKVAVKVLRAIRLDIPEEDTLLKKLVDTGPLAVGMNAFDLRFYKGGILLPDKCKGQQPNHAVVLVGYGEENGTKFWIIKNSWGQKWGESGYLRLIRGVNACVMGTSYTATATVA